MNGRFLAKRRWVAALAVCSILAAAAGTVFAAGPDLGPVDPEQPAPDWGGFFIGAGAGFGAGGASSQQNFVQDGTVFAAPPVAPSGSRPSGTGFQAGVGAGYRWQAGRVVFGAGADVTAGTVGGSATQSGTFGGAPYTATQRATIDWLSTARGTLGYTPIPRLLVYGTGGLGVGQVTERSGVTTGSGSYAGKRALIQPVWVAGAGIEVKITPRLAAKLEYLHQGFGTTTTVSPGSAQAGQQFQSNFGIAADTVMAGVSYRFGADGGAYTDPTAILSAPIETYTGEYLSELSYDFGVRSWLSTGSMTYKLGAATFQPQVSQLDYTSTTATSAELFARVEHSAGPMLKGTLGLALSGGGGLKDQDFPPFVVPYSATLSSQRNGSIAYGSLDAGYEFGPGPGQGWRLAPFAGFGFIREQFNAYGCNQIAANPDICSNISPSVLGISEDATWSFLRVGVAGSVDLPGGFALEADVAWVPYGALNGADTHWLRTDIHGPIQQTAGNVSGVQIDAALRYRLNDWLDLGAGGRYWRLTADGRSVFETGFGQSNQKTRFTTDRYGPFFQVNVRL